MKLRFDENGYIINVSDNPALDFHEDIAKDFVEVPTGAPANVGVGWRFSGSDWVAPPSSPVLVQPADLTFVQFVGLAMQAGGMTPTAYATASANPALVVFFDLLKHAQGLRKDDPMMAIGGAAFVSEGMLTQAGWDAMLANWPTA